MTPSPPAALASLGLAALLLGGCAPWDGVETAATPRDPAALTMAEADQATATAAWPDEAWWTAYGDDQLDGLIREALSSAPTLRIAAARIRQAAAQAGLAEARLSPRLDASASIIDQRFNENGLYPTPPAGQTHTNNRLALDGGYTLDLWGGREADYRAALGRLRAGEVEAQAVRLDLASTIAQTYVALAAAHDQRDIDQDLLRQQQEILTIATKLSGAGLTTEVETRQAEAALAATRSELADLEERIALLRQDLGVLVGAGPDRGARIERPRLAGPAGLALPSRLPADLLGHRPDIVAQRWRVEAASQAIGAAKAEFYPNIDLSAFLGFQSIGLDTFLKAGSLMVGAGPTISLPIFDAGRRRAALAGADAEYDLAVEQYNQTLLDALRDIAGQLRSWRACQDRLAHDRHAVGQLGEAYRLALLRYREGLANYLTVLSAEGDLTAARRREAEARNRQITLSIALVHALGGGGVPSPAPEPAKGHP